MIESLQLSTSKTRNVSDFWDGSPNQLFRLSTRYRKKFDIIYIDNYLNNNKFTEIVLYEALTVLKLGGVLVVSELNESKIRLAYEFLKTSFSFRHRVSLWLGETENSLKVSLLRRGVPSTSAETGWTFGIITNGSRDNTLSESVEQIKELKIENYEIIVCGKTAIDLAGVKMIQFSEKDSRGWITRKKNLICEEAQFENLCILHDRIILDNNWYSGMCKWGDSFEVLSFPVFVKFDGHEYKTNWERVPRRADQLSSEKKLWHDNASLDSRDWDPDVYVSGVGIALKKTVWKQFKWNEELFWADAEDIELSHRQTAGGIVLRHNPYSSATAKHSSGVLIRSWHDFSETTLGKYRTEFPFYKFLAIKLLDLLGVRRDGRLGKQLINRVKKTKGASSWK